MFLANVSAVLATALVVMSSDGLLRVRTTAKGTTRRWRRPGVVVEAALVVIVAVPLATTSIKVTRATVAEQSVNSVAPAWADDHGWSVVSVTSGSDGFDVRMVGPSPVPRDGVSACRSGYRRAGDQQVTVELVPEERTTFGPTG